ncbi:hypothetical protein D3C78_1273910 [compost metagenome]
MLGAELQGVGAQAGRAVGDGQAYQIGLAGAGELRVHLDGGVDLLALLVQRYQAFGRLDLGEQGQLLLAGDLGFFRLQSQHVAIGAELAARPGRAVVLAVEAGAVGVRVVLLGHVLDPAALDLAAVGGVALDGDAEPLGAEFLFHAEESSELPVGGGSVRAWSAGRQ